MKSFVTFCKVKATIKQDDLNTVEDSRDQDLEVLIQKENNQYEGRSLNKSEIEKFMTLYEKLPVTTHNKKQNVIKKRWLQGYDQDLEKLFCQKLAKEIGNYLLYQLFYWPTTFSECV